MEEEKLNLIVEKAYNNLIDVAQYNLTIPDGYFRIIVPKEKESEYMPYLEDILNLLFFKFCLKLKNQNLIQEDIPYYSFTKTTAKKEVIEDCFLLVKKATKKSSTNTTLYSLIKPLEEKYTHEDIKNIINILFDILLDYSLEI